MGRMRQLYKCGTGVSTAAQQHLHPLVAPDTAASSSAPDMALVCCRFVEQSHPGMGSGFELKTQYPSKTLTDQKQTLQDAQLENALIIQS